MRRLKLELKQTMDMYNNACKEAITAKQKVRFGFDLSHLSLCMSVSKSIMVVQGSIRMKTF